MSGKSLSKIGVKIIVVVSALLIIVAAAITIGFVILFTNAETVNLREETIVASNVLQSEIMSKADETQVLAYLLSGDTRFTSAIENKDTDTIVSIWNGISKSNGIFGVFADKDGIIRYKTDNCEISAEGLFDVVSSEKTGMFTDKEASLFYRSSVKFDGGIITVGYSYSDNAIVDSVYDRTKAHATIYCDNARISTTIPMESGERAVGTTMLTDVYDKVITGGEAYVDEVTMFGAEYMASYTPIIDSNGIVKGALFTGSPMGSMIRNRNMAIFIGIAIGLLMIVISSFTLIIFISNSISKPITAVKQMAFEMEHGNLHGNITSSDSIGRNEIGDLAESISTAIMILDRYVGDISNMMREMSEGNFGYESEVTYTGDFVSIGESAETLRARMKDVIESINVSADEVYNGSEQISNGASVLADGTTRQAAASQELSASLDDISRNISFNANNAEKAQELSNSSIKMVNKQNEEIGNMLEAMDNIENSAAEISKIIKAIEDIAFQTNILALNAAVEAARAGAAGKGFAVVADEVRNLANKSAEAANNTSVLIGGCIDAVNHGSAIANKTAEAMKRVIAITNETNELIEGIAQQTIKQEESVRQVKTGIDQISDVIQQNSATAEESAASCEQLNAQALTLRDKIAIFHT